MLDRKRQEEGDATGRLVWCLKSQHLEEAPKSKRTKCRSAGKANGRGHSLYLAYRLPQPTGDVPLAEAFVRKRVTRMKRAQQIGNLMVEQESQDRQSGSIDSMATTVIELERVAHEHKQTKAVMDQLARTAGHVTSIRRMVGEGRDCTEILVQLAAVRASIDRTSRLVLEDHIESCVRGTDSVNIPDDEWDRLKRALDSFIR